MPRRRRRTAAAHPTLPPTRLPTHLGRALHRHTPLQPHPKPLLLALQRAPLVQPTTHRSLAVGGWGGGSGQQGCTTTHSPPRHTHTSTAAPPDHPPPQSTHSPLQPLLLLAAPPLLHGCRARCGLCLAPCLLCSTSRSTLLLNHCSLTCLTRPLLSIQLGLMGVVEGEGGDQGPTANRARQPMARACPPSSLPLPPLPPPGPTCASSYARRLASRSARSLSASRRAS